MRNPWYKTLMSPLSRIRALAHFAGCVSVYPGGHANGYAEAYPQNRVIAKSGFWRGMDDRTVDPVVSKHINTKTGYCRNLGVWGEALIEP